MRLPKGLNLVEYNGQTLAKLYNTMIVVIEDKDTGKTFKLNSGGWLTKHTKKCMNLILNKHNVYVYQKNFEWFITTPQGLTIPFTDNISFTA